MKPERTTGLSLQRCSTDGPAYEEMPADRKEAVEHYMYDGMLTTDADTDQIPAPLEIKWGPDKFLLTFSHIASGNDAAGKLSVKVDFKGKQNPKTPGAPKDNSLNYDIPMPGKGALAMLVENNDANTLNIWPYGKAAQNMRVEFQHEGPHFYDNENSRGRLHHFTLRNRTTGTGYISGPFYIADKEAKKGDYPEAPDKFYTDHKEGPLAIEPSIYLNQNGSEARLDADADYYKELVLRWKSAPDGDKVKYAASAFYIPSDPKGLQPKIFNFSVDKNLVTGNFERITNTADGGSDTIIALGDFNKPQLFWHIQMPVVKNGQVTYAWKLNDGQNGTFSFPLPANYKKPESQFDLPAKGGITTGRIWAEDFTFGPLRDAFRVTMGIEGDASKEAFFNIRTTSAGISGYGNIKVPLAGIGHDNPFLPTITNTEGKGIDITVDKNATIQLHVYGQVTQEENFMGSTNTRKHRLRVKGTGLAEDYFFEYKFDDQRAKPLGGLSFSATGNQAAGKDENFASDTKTLSLDVLAQNKTFEKRRAEQERELIFIRKKAQEEGVITEEVFSAWSNLNGLVILYTLTPTPENKKSLLAAIDSYVATYKNTAVATVAALKVAIEGGKHAAIAINYFNLLSPMDQEIVEKFSKSAKPVVQDLGLKTAYLLDVTGKMSEMRQFDPLLIPATFAIKELYDKGLPQYGHALELYAYKDGSRLHLKNLTNRKEIKHVETPIPSGSKNKPVASLLQETNLINKLNDPDLFPKGLLNYTIPGAKSNTLVTEGGMNATS